jgi:hypothetical protein
MYVHSMKELHNKYVIMTNIIIILTMESVSQLLHARFDSSSFVFFMWFNGIYICCSAPDILPHWLSIVFIVERVSVFIMIIRLK